jgi:uncharacterized protein VirK/YbjX
MTFLVVSTLSLVFHQFKPVGDNQYFHVSHTDLHHLPQLPAFLHMLSPRKKNFAPKIELPFLCSTFRDSQRASTLSPSLKLAMKTIFIKKTHHSSQSSLKKNGSAFHADMQVHYCFECAPLK